MLPNDYRILVQAYASAHYDSSIRSSDSPETMDSLCIGVPLTYFFNFSDRTKWGTKRTGQDHRIGSHHASSYVPNGRRHCGYSAS